MQALAALLSLSLMAPPDAIGPQPPPDACAPKVRTVLRDSRVAVSDAERRTTAALARAERLERELADVRQDDTTRTAWVAIGSAAAGLLVGALVVGLAVKYGDD